MAFRRRIWVDVRVQGALVGRAVIYWLVAFLYFGTTVFVSNYCDYPHWTFSQHIQEWFTIVGPWIPSAALILPLVVYDIVRLSHQFVGPVLRAKKQLERIVQSPNCTPYTLRTDDYWHDLIKPMNDVQNHILSLHVALQKAIEALSEEDASYANKRLAQTLKQVDKVGPRPKVKCLDAAVFQELQETKSAS
jgi:hypothetical protein